MEEDSSQFCKASKRTHTSYITLWFVCAFFLVLCFLSSCHEKVETTAEAISPTDTLPFMQARGINTLISDSGVMRYRMVAEEWDIYNTGRTPATWKFMKGLLMERFDENFHVDLYIQSDTAYLHKQHMWELRGRVVIRNIRNEVFLTEELFWDMNTHEIWNHAFMRIITSERELHGTEFRSNERMTKYSVSNSSGAFPVSDTETGPATTDTVAVMQQDINHGPTKVQDKQATKSSLPQPEEHEVEKVKMNNLTKRAEKATIAKPANNMGEATLAKPIK